MSRPKPDIILDFTDRKTYRSEQVIKADAIYAVFFGEQPINLRTRHAMLDYPPAKYKKVSFSNPGHAKNLANKLNKLFKTDKFAVHRLTTGEVLV